MPVKGTIGSKSRLGCKTSKTRRVKCGEEKPNCLRCTSTGRKCEYEAAVSGSFSSTLVTVSIYDNPLSESSNTVWRERRAFAYYFQYAAPFVGGGLEVDFWRTIVPQENFCALKQNHRDALGWYSRSVTAVRQRIERGAVDVFVGLVSCLLFICIEALQGSTEEALRLYGQGVYLILALRAQVASGALPPTKAFLVEETIVPIFTRLGAIALALSRAPVNALLPDTEHALTQESVSLRSARDAIVLLAAEAQLFESTCEEHLLQSRASNVPLKLINQQMTLSARLRSWYIAFTKWTASLHAKDALSPDQTSTRALLLTYHEMIFIILATCILPSRMLIDAYLPNFQNIVELSTIALDASAQSDGTQPPFTFEISVGLPIWLTCLRCRKPRTRRMALALLRRAPQVQGFYKCTPGVTLGEAIMKLEETYASAMDAAQMTNSTTPGSTNAPGAYQSHTRGNSGDMTSSPITLSDSELVPRRYPAPDMESNTPTVFIPEDARIRPLGTFRPREGFPPGTTEEDIVKWNPSLDQSLTSTTWAATLGR